MILDITPSTLKAAQTCKAGDTLRFSGDIASIPAPAQWPANLTFDLSGARLLGGARLARLINATILNPTLAPNGPKVISLSIEDSDTVTVQGITGKGQLAQGGDLPGGIGINVLNSKGVTIQMGRFDGFRTPILAKGVERFTLESLDFTRTGEDCIGIGGSRTVRGRNLRAWGGHPLPDVHPDMIQFKDDTVNVDIAFDRVWGHGALQIFQAKGVDTVTGAGALEDVTLSNFNCWTTMGGAMNVQRAVRCVIRDCEISTLPGAANQAHIDDRGADVRYEGRVMAWGYGGAGDLDYVKRAAL